MVGKTKYGHMQTLRQSLPFRQRFREMVIHSRTAQV